MYIHKFMPISYWIGRNYITPTAMILTYSFRLVYIQYIYIWSFTRAHYEYYATVVTDVYHLKLLTRDLVIVASSRDFSEVVG